MPEALQPAPQERGVGRRLLGADLPGAAVGDHRRGRRSLSESTQPCTARFRRRPEGAAESPCRGRSALSRITAAEAFAVPSRSREFKVAVGCAEGGLQATAYSRSDGGIYRMPLDSECATWWRLGACRGEPIRLGTSTSSRETPAAERHDDRRRAEPAPRAHGACCQLQGAAAGSPGTRSEASPAPPGPCPRGTAVRLLEHAASCFDLAAPRPADCAERWRLPWRGGGSSRPVPLAVQLSRACCDQRREGCCEGPRGALYRSALWSVRARAF